MSLLVRILTFAIAQFMTTIRYGPIVADARGSTGGTTFSRGPFGAYTKARVAPTNPNTDKQAAARALLSTIVDRWMTVLTVAQRDAWNAAVQAFTVPNRIGDAIHLTGMQWYIRCNILLDLTGQALVAVPPIVPIVPAPTFKLNHVAASGVQVVAIGNWDETAHDQLSILTSPNLSQTKNFYKGPWDVNWTLPCSDFSALPVIVRASVNLVIDSRMFFSFRTVNADGANSFPVIYSRDVGDPV